MTEQEALELGKKLYANIINNENNIIKTNDYIEFAGMTIKALEEVQQYRVIGTVSELQDLVIGINALADSQFSAADMAKLVNDMKSLYEYRQIGTVEECRAAVEKQKEMIAYCDENDCAGCPYHNGQLKENRCMNDFIADEIAEQLKGGGVNE